jgi:hypothetical protein
MHSCMNTDIPVENTALDLIAADSCPQRGAKEAGKQAGDAARQGADFAADKTEDAGAAAEDYSKTGADKVRSRACPCQHHVGFSRHTGRQAIEPPAFTCLMHADTVVSMDHHHLQCS